MKNSEFTDRISSHLEAALSRALSSMTGQEFTIARTEPEIAAELAEPIIWRQVFSFAPDQPSFWLAAGKELWTLAGQLTLAAVGIDAASDEDCRSTWHEIVGQTMGGVATAFTAEAKREITTVSGEEISSEPEFSQWLRFEVRHGGQTYSFKAAWLPVVDSQFEHDAAAQERTDEGLKQSAASANNAFSKTFDLLLDVALPVNVSFGRTSLQIREVLKLNTGSIVELDRLVVEPVEVIVNDCVIARGEVVVVDGNYGVRVTQLASREDRLRFGISQTSARVAAGAGGAA